jgi:DNA polymerase sigma
MTGQSNAGSNSGAGCRFETALVNSRRRIPYSVGSDTLAVVPPGSYHARLDEKEERCLSVDILDLYHVLLSWSRLIIATFTY